MTITADMTMKELLDAYPGAQRALFRRYHIGGCASCGFRPEETVAEVCARNDNLDPGEVLETVRSAHEQDELLMISPPEAAALAAGEKTCLVDIRTKEEFEAVHIKGSLLFNQALMQEILGSWPKDRAVVIVDHLGLRALDAAAYLAGHGFSHIQVLRGGIDAWSQEVDASLPRYTLE